MKIAIAQINPKVGDITGNAALVVGFVDRNPAAKGKALLNSIALLHGGNMAAKRGKSLLQKANTVLYRAEPKAGRSEMPAMAPVEFLRRWTLLAAAQEEYGTGPGSRTAAGS